jgi:hypothetical protein
LLARFRYFSFLSHLLQSKVCQTLSMKFPSLSITCSVFLPTFYSLLALSWFMKKNRVKNTMNIKKLGFMDFDNYHHIVFLIDKFMFLCLNSYFNLFFAFFVVVM